VGIWTKNILNKLALMGRSPGLSSAVPAGLSANLQFLPGLHSRNLHPESCTPCRTANLHNTHRHPAVNDHVLPGDEIIFHQRRNQRRNILRLAFYM
jgi:hypothetical protein